MPLAIVHSRGLDGLSAPEVAVEVHLAGGLPRVTLVGLPDTEVKEAGDRVRAALHNSGFEFPSKRITVNLAPADLPKESGRFDLPIALGILAASGQIPGKMLNDYEFAGEKPRYGQWQAYIPGPYQRHPWHEDDADADRSPDALADGGIYEAGRGLKLLTPLQQG